MLGEGEAAEPAEEPEEKPEVPEGEGRFRRGEDQENLSLSMLEEKLKPQVMETFGQIAGTYMRLFKLQAQRHRRRCKKAKKSRRSPTRNSRRAKDDLVELVRTVRLNNHRLEQLVQQLYTLNRRLVGVEGRIMRLALDSGVKREDFLARYTGHELDRNWLA